MESILNGLLADLAEGVVASILLHSCCGPCATYTVKSLREHDFEVSACWYNPNVHPFTEHQKRLESMRALAEKVNLPLTIIEGYDMIDFFRAVVGHESERCADCYRLRLGKTAQLAREKGFDAFTTSLLISPYQKHDLLKEIGEEVGRQNGVEFYYQDFRGGFRESRRMAQELGLYLQKYCGCVYSEWERYGKVKIT
ncbi:MAG: epoxyqueuosine reductase QueH [Dehalococcoidia bacterium]|nr:epoxyqueuosine reductase QueH [Dehalococcoidia bacterium]